MKAIEYRIGNLIFDAECEPYYFEIEELRKYVGSEIWAYYRKGSIKNKEPEPIPLTEEWLLKFGGKMRGIFIEFGKISIIQKGAPNYPNGRTYFNSWAIIESQPEYVHQLQNLYFALTNQELCLQNK